MTFAKQIEGVPLPWVQQGWRLQPSDEFENNWRQASPFNRWDYEAIEVEGAYLDIARPVIEPANGPRVYAHAGWSGGLAPTDEMVKIWTWWWYLPAGNDRLHAVDVVLDGDRVLLECADGSFCLVADAKGEWRGPVLPPMEMIP